MRTTTRSIIAFSLGCLLAACGSLSAQLPTPVVNRIEEAIQALPPAGGTLHLPAGEYEITKTVDIDRPVILDCEPGAWFCKSSLGYMFRAKSSDVTFRNAGFLRDDTHRCNLVLDRKVPVAEAGHYQRWTFDGCTFDGVAVYLERCDRTFHDGAKADVGSDVDSGVRFRDCVFRNVQVAATLWLGGVQDVVIDGCRFERCGVSAGSGDAIKVTAGSRDVRIVNNLFRKTARDAIDLFDASRCTITGNVIEDCGAIGIDAKTYSTCANPTEFHVIANNRIEQCEATGLSLDVHDVTCTGNVAIDCLDGFRNVATDSGSTRIARGVFTGNRAVRCKRNGFYFGGEHTTAHGNQAVDCRRAYLVTAINSEIGGNL